MSRRRSSATHSFEGRSNLPACSRGYTRFCVVVYNKDRNCLYREKFPRIVLKRGVEAPRNFYDGKPLFDGYLRVVFNAESTLLASFMTVSHCLMATSLIVYNAESTLLASFMTLSHSLMATSLIVYNAESTLLASFMMESHCLMAIPLIVYKIV